MLANLVLIAVELLVGGAPGGQIGIAAVTGSLGIGEHQLYVVPGQVVPALNILGVTFTHQKRHGGEIGRTVVGQTSFPVGGDQLAFLVQHIHIGHLVVGNHIGTQALQNGLCLAGRAGMRLFDLQLFTGLLLPMFGEHRVDVGKQLAGDVVAAVEQFLCLKGNGGA